ncbi:hypothetical protein [Neomoorella thermoacetica]|uniref:hypothetical protein n=1 Tax=Neomoorella thermoacetica TaxID=1525 RepID=UPI00069E06AA|nr:hypothetical protein [Moorella thermoacetica]AKX97604.1 hypothetical protein MOTHA_c22680 [Moorella thermoacetica]
MRRWTWVVLTAILLVVLVVTGRLDKQDRQLSFLIPGVAGNSISGSDDKSWKEYQNNYDGFSLAYPEDWQQEVIPGVATILTKAGYVKLTVLAQPLGKISAEEYVLYSNRSLQEGWGGIKLQDQKKLNLRGYSAWQFDWTRPQLGPGDLNYYREYDLVDGKTVYTFMLKSNQANFAAATKDLNRIILTFKPCRLREPLPCRRHRRCGGRLPSKASTTAW